MKRFSTALCALLFSMPSFAGEYYFFEDTSKMKVAFEFLNSEEIIRPDGYLNTGFFKHVKSENLGSYLSGPFVYRERSKQPKAVMFLNPGKATGTNCAAISRELGDSKSVSSTLAPISCDEARAVYVNARIPGEYANYTPLKDHLALQDLSEKVWESDRVHFDYTAILDSLQTYNASMDSYMVFGKEYKPYTSKHFLDAWDALQITFSDFIDGKSSLQINNSVTVKDQVGSTTYTRNSSMTGRLVFRELRVNGVVKSIIVWANPALPEQYDEFAGENIVRMTTVDPALTSARTVNDLLVNPFKPGQCFTEGTDNACEFKKTLVYSVTSEGEFLKIKFNNDQTITLSVSKDTKQTYHRIPTE